MNLLSPLSLLLLLPAGGVIALLYLLRVKRRDRVVSSVMFWQAALADTRANAPFQKLKRNLLLFLQLLAVLLLAVALARPFRWAAGLDGKATAIVLDASASMNARDETGGRFQSAVREATALVKQKNDGDAVAIVVAGVGRPTVLSSLTTDRAATLRALQAARPTDAPNGDTLPAAIQLGAQLVAARTGAQVLVVSDGAFPPLEDLRLGGAALRFLLVGKRARNLAITAFDVRDAFASGSGGGGAAKSGRQAFVTIQNFGDKTVTATPLELHAGTGADSDALLDARALDLAPSETKSVVFDNFDRATRTSGTVMSARLDTDDDLDADNAAYAVLPPDKGARVLLVTTGDPFILRALEADKGVVVEEKSPAAFKTNDVQKRDVTIFDGDDPPPANLPPGRYLFWGTQAPKTTGKGPAAVVPVFADSGGDADRPQVLDWDRTHPLLRFTDLPGVKLLRSHRVLPAPWARTLAETEAGPLIVAGERGETRAVYVGFSLFNSDMPLRVTFPIFVSNCVRYLSASGRASSQNGGAVAARPGGAVAIAAPAKAAPLTVTLPSGGGTVRVATVSPTGGAIYDNTPRVGVYSVSGGAGFRDRFAVSLLSPDESNTRPIARPTYTVADGDGGKDGVQVTRGTNGARDLLVRREWWPWAVGAVLFALVVEWAAYHRQGIRAANKPPRTDKRKTKTVRG